MPFPDATGWVSGQQDFSATPPQYIADLIGPYDTSRFYWDQNRMSLVDRYNGGSYYYGNVPDPAQGTQVVTDLSAYNASGGQDGVINYGQGQNPYFGFGDSASGYGAGDAPYSGMFISADPNAIADYRSHADDVTTRGALIAASIPAAAGIASALTGGGAAAGAGGAAAADGLTPITVGASTLPGGVPAIGAASGAVWGAGAGSALPAVASLPAAIATPAAINAFTGTAGTVAGTAAGNALGGAAGGAGNALGGAAGSILDNWLPYITSGINTLLGANAANQAADAEAAAMRDAIAEQRRQYDTTRADFEPWMAAGRDALNQLANPQARFLASPGYEWARNEGTRGIENSFAARGGAKSGNALRALGDFTTGLAQQDYNSWWNQQAGRAGVGQAATSNVANVGANAANQTSNYLANTGVARGAGILGRNSAVASGLNDAVSNWLYRRRAA